MSALFKKDLHESSLLFSKDPNFRTIGAFEGANYEAKGYYRSQMQCLMFDRSEQFCRVCQDGISAIIDLYSRWYVDAPIDVVYNWISTYFHRLVHRVCLTLSLKLGFFACDGKPTSPLSFFNDLRRNLWSIVKDFSQLFVSIKHWYGSRISSPKNASLTISSNPLKRHLLALPVRPSYKPFTKSDFLQENHRSEEKRNLVSTQSGIDK